MRKVLATLTVSVLILLGGGFALLASASAVRAQQLFNDPHHFVKSQALWLFLGLACSLFVSRLDYRYVKRFPACTIGAGAVVLLLLAAVVCPGLRHEINGSARWLCIAGRRIGQPSELAKIMTVILSAYWLDRIGGEVKSFWKGLLIPGLAVGAVCCLLALEPDFGAMAVLGVLFLSMLFVAGGRIRHIALVGLVGAAGIGLMVLRTPNRMARISAFMEGSESKSHAGHQLAQSILSFKNGGIPGVGYTQSIQKYSYLPEAHTDFIFPIGGEELGIAFSLGVLILFGAVTVCGFLIAYWAQDRLGRFLAFGMTFLISFQAFFNIGVVTGCLPTKGIALPFISYGGTNLLVALVSVGVVINVGRRIERQREGAALSRLAKNIPLEI